MEAAWDLGDRIDHIRNRRFLDYLAEGGGLAHGAKLATLFRFAHYFGWREVVRTQVQLLRFENEQDTRLVAGFLADVMRVLASDRLAGTCAMLWLDEQRAIGELMTTDRDGAPTSVRGHATFHRNYEELFAPWMERFAEGLLGSRAVESERLRLLQWALFGVVLLLDEEQAYRDSVWTENAAAEIRKSSRPASVTKTELRLRDRLTASGVV